MAVTEVRENASVGIWSTEGGSGGTWDQATFVGGNGWLMLQAKNLHLH